VHCLCVLQISNNHPVSLIWAVSASNAVVIFQWYFWGYTLAFSPSATNGFIGNLRSFGLLHVEADPSPGSPLIPEILYSFFQMEFACVTAGILMGGLAERGRVLPAMVFIFFWMTLVYCPLACWVWSTNGWAFKWGVLDFAGTSSSLLSIQVAWRHSLIYFRRNLLIVHPFSFAGGGPVEIGSGIGGLAFSWVLGRRHERELLNFRPHNVSLVGLGSECSSLLTVSRLICHPKSVHALVRLARVQRGQRLWCQSPSDLCYLEYNARSCIWRHGLVPSRFPHRTKMEYGRLLFRDYRWARSSNTLLWIPQTMVISYCWYSVRGIV